MAKKKRVLLNPKKFGKKYFEFLDNLDGTDDNQIRSSTVPLTIRTLNLSDNGDRTIKLSAELYGSASTEPRISYSLIMTGGVAASVSGNEAIEIASTGSTGYVFTSSLPALQDASGPIVLPTGRTTVRARLYDFGAPGTTILTLDESITVKSAPIGLTSTMLSGALSGNVGSAWEGTNALGINLDDFIGTGAQHGSGSGVGSAAVYNVKDNAHGFLVAVSGAANGALTLSTGSANNGHALSGVVELLSGSQVEALTPETLTVTFTPRDVNNALSTDEAVTFNISVED